MKMRSLVLQLLVGFSLAGLSSCSEDTYGPGPDAMKKMMVKVSACTGEDTFRLTMAAAYALDVAGEGLQKYVDRLFGCMESANNCDKVLACSGYDAKSPCNPADFEDKCEGNKRIRCGELADGRAFKETYDCAAEEPYNKKCQVETDGDVVCGAGDCDGSKDEWCEGTVMLKCEDGALDKSDCADFGLKCIATADGAMCGTGETCTGKESCDGATYVSCEDGNEELPVDCSWFGSDYTCVQASKDNAACAVPDSKEECTNEKPVCVGSKARICFGGQWMEFDCAAFGGATCELTDKSFLGDGIRCKAK